MTLNPKQEMFVNEYLKCFNATKAAKLAGYSERSAYSIGQRLLKNDEIATRVRDHLNAGAMEANEVLYHLAQIARGDMDDLLDAKGNLDLEKARRFGKTNLIKRVKNRAITTEQSDISETETEGYDRLKALELIGKYLAIFTERLRIDDWRTEIIDLLSQGKITPEQLEAELGTGLAQEFIEQGRLRVLAKRESE